MRLAVLLVLCASACGDNLSVVVDVTHPSPVAKTVISVYESDAVDCTKIEFGDIGAATLAATLVAEETHLADGTVTGDLDGLSRTADKSIVARGYDANDELVTAGCTTKGVVHGRDHVAVDTVPAMIISAVADSGDPYTITVLATKPDGALLTKREVSWQVYAPIGTAPLNASLATVTGESGVAADQERLYQRQRGGEAASGSAVADRRLRDASPRLVGCEHTPVRDGDLEADVTVQYPLRLPSTVKHACAVKIAGGGSIRRLICIDTEGVSTPVARELMITVGNGRGAFTMMGTATLTTPPVGVFAKPATTPGDQDVYMVDTSGDQKPLFGAPSVMPTACAACVNVVSDFLFAPACSPPDNEAKLYLQEPGGLRMMSAAGGLTTPLAQFIDSASLNFRLKSAGCVSQMTPQATKLDRQVAVLDVAVSTTLTVTRAFYNCDLLGCNKLLLPVGAGGVGFATSMTGERRMVGPSIDATGLVMSSWIIRPLFDTATRIDQLLERDRLPAAQAPHELVIGKLDDDDGYDLAWDIDGRTMTTLDLAYSRMAGDQRLEVIAPLANVTVEDLQLEDLSGDQHPELIIIGTSGSGPGNTTPVVAIPTHVAPSTTATAPEECK
ncbi:MAG: hypothetical protein IPQ07_39575 [Myxococcales bacterium]|nr:hypothetical protein [Myxococcales bacterium]